MANYNSTADLKKEVLQACGELTDGTSSYDAQVITYLNVTQHTIVAGGKELNIEMGEPWSWAKSANPGTLVLDPPYTTGTITLTNGSVNGVFSGAPAASLAGRLLKVDNRPEYFRIATHTGGATAFTLDTAYTDSSGAGLGFKAYKLDYTTASSIVRLVGPLRAHRLQGLSDNDRSTNSGEISGMEVNQFNQQFPLIYLEDGTPTAFCQLSKTSGGVITLRMNRSVQTQTKVEYDYIPVPADLTDSDLSIPLVPREHRTTLVYCAAFKLSLDKNDSRAQNYEKLAVSGLEAMVQANRRERQHQSKQKGRIVPRRDLFRSRRPYTQRSE